MEYDEFGGISRKFHLGKTFVGLKIGVRKNAKNLVETKKNLARTITLSGERKARLRKLK